MLVGGASTRAVASHFGVSRQSLDRFKKTIPMAIARAEDMRCADRLRLGEDLHTHTTDLQKAALNFFNAAVERGDEAVAAIWFDRLLKAGGFRLQVEAVRQGTPSPSIVAERIMRQDRIAVVGEKFFAAVEKVRAEKGLPPILDLDARPVPGARPK